MTARESAAVRVLLVSGDAIAVDMLCEVMEHMHIHVEVCPEPKAAAHKLRRSKYEGVVVDLLLGEGSVQLLQQLPDFPSNKAAVSCAILHDAHQKASAFRAGANFVLPRPLEKQTVSRTIRAAYPMMVRERRRYLRLPVHVTALVSAERHQQFQATSTNIGECGMAMISPQPLKAGQKLVIRLSISGKTDFLTLHGEVRWIDTSRKTGVQFMHSTELLAEALELWQRRNSKKCRTHRARRTRH